ncbi:lysoplasmalogenase [Gordonia sp. HNM0687]|uniref:Lysoplasmalogenase n=1 Tax=Gordonia mangrovi TaxID=2665643 RepID=A0A6L7GLR9_9ACTN|nr:lysoplasmalogenase [Gordonia mangrovi]
MTASAGRIQRRLDRGRDAYFVAAAAATAAGAAHHRSLAALTKPLPLLLLGTRIARRAGARSAFDNALLAGAIAFSTAGDRAMLLEEFADEPTEKDRHLRVGASLFAGAQLCLTAAMMRRGARPGARGLITRAAVLAESATVLALHRPRLLPVLGGYGNTLALMSATAAGMSDPQPAMRTGGLLFLASDLTIINRRHLVRNRRLAAAGEAWVLASYFAAQWLLLTGLGATRGDED